MTLLGIFGIILDAQQGAEKDRVFKEVLEKYTVNENKMLLYADRRRKKKEANQYLGSAEKGETHIYHLSYQ